MEDIYTQMDEAFDRLWEECSECKSKDHNSKDHPTVVVMPNANSPIGTTNVKGNLARRAYNDASNETKIKSARKAVKPATDE